MTRRVKTADLKGALKGALGNALASPAMWGAVGAPFIGMAARSVENRFNAKRDATLKVQAYREMMDLHPHLGRQNPEQTVRLYNSLYNASPHMARDPLAAGAYIDHIQNNTVHGQTSHQALIPIIERLSGVQKNIADIDRHRVRTPRSDKIESLVTSAGSELQKAYKENMNATDAARIKDMNMHEERFKRERDNLVREQLRERVRAVEEREHDLGLQNKWQNKKASRAPLASMLRALKV
jgi:hypothetical protein